MFYYSALFSSDILVVQRGLICSGLWSDATSLFHFNFSHSLINSSERVDLIIRGNCVGLHWSCHTNPIPPVCVVHADAREVRWRSRYRRLHPGVWGLLDTDLWTVLARSKIKGQQEIKSAYFSIWCYFFFHLDSVVWVSWFLEISACSFQKIKQRLLFSKARKAYFEQVSSEMCLQTRNCFQQSLSIHLGNLLTVYLICFAQNILYITITFKICFIILYFAAALFQDYTSQACAWGLPRPLSCPVSDLRVPGSPWSQPPLSVSPGGARFLLASWQHVSSTPLSTLARAFMSSVFSSFCLPHDFPTAETQTQSNTQTRSR